MNLANLLAELERRHVWGGLFAVNISLRNPAWDATRRGKATGDTLSIAVLGHLG